MRVFLKGLLRPTALLILIALSSACGRKSKAVAPPLVITAPPQQPAPAAPEPLPSPPGVEATSGAGLPKVDAPPIAQPAKPTPAQKTRTTRRPAQTPPPSVTTTEPAPQVAPQPATPQLTQLLTPAEQQAYNTAIDEALQRTQQNLGRASGRKLTTEQSLNMERITNFVQQANQARQTDLVTARSLAQRADVLAQDLVNGLR
ncbi:MAG: hypothetical protein JJE04_12230 [Acidobacteriia bacterium]|nr:hypothetical protein [Terriglobia bacterium]